MVQSRVAGDSQDPGCEGHVPRLVLPDHRDQLDEDVLSDVLGLVMILNEASYVAQDVVCVADVEEVKSLHVPVWARAIAALTIRLSRPPTSEDRPVSAVAVPSSDWILVNSR